MATYSRTPPIESIPIPVKTWESFIHTLLTHGIKYGKFQALRRDSGNNKIIHLPHHDYISEPCFNRVFGAHTEYVFCVLHYSYLQKWTVTGPHYFTHSASSTPTIWDSLEKFQGISKEEYTNVIRIQRTMQKGSKEAGLNLNIESKNISFQPPHNNPPISVEAWSKFINKVKDTKIYKLQVSCFDNNSSIFEDFPNSMVYISKPKLLKSGDPLTLTATTSTNENWISFCLWPHTLDGAAEWTVTPIFPGVGRIEAPSIWDAIEDAFPVTKEDYLERIRAKRITQKGSKEAGMNLNIESTIGSVLPPDNLMQDFKNLVAKHKLKYYRFYALIKNPDIEFVPTPTYDYVSDFYYDEASGNYKYIALYLGCIGKNRWTWYVEDRTMKALQPHDIWDCYRELSLISKQEYLNFIRPHLVTKRGSKEAGMNLNIESAAEMGPTARGGRDTFLQSDVPVPPDVYLEFKNLLQNNDNPKVYRFYSTILKKGKAVIGPTICFDYISAPIFVGNSPDSDSRMYKYVTLFFSDLSSSLEEEGEWAAREFTFDWNKPGKPTVWDCFERLSGIGREQYKQVHAVYRATKRGSREAGLNLNVESAAEMGPTAQGERDGPFKSQIPIFPHIKPYTLRSKVVNGYIDTHRNAKRKVYQFYHLRHNSKGKIELETQKPLFISSIVHSQIPSITAMNQTVGINYYELLYWDYDHWQRCDLHAEIYKDIWKAYTRITGVSKQEYLNYVKILRATERGSQEAGLNLNIESASQNIEKPTDALLNEFLAHVKEHNLKYYRFLSLVERDDGATEILKPYAYDYISEPYAGQEGCYYYWVLCKFENDSGLGYSWDWAVKRMVLQRALPVNIWSCLESLTGANKEMYKKLYHTFIVTQRGSREAGLNLDVESTQAPLDKLQVFLNTAHNEKRKVYKFFWPHQSQKGFYFNPGEYVYVTAPYLNLQAWLRRPEYRLDYFITTVNDGDSISYTVKPNIWYAFKTITGCDKEHYINLLKALRTTQKGSKQAGMNLDVESQSGFKKYLSDTSAKPESTI